jgi:prophage maintenance system killer protein
MGKKKKVGAVVIYQSKTGAIELKGDFRRETIWANLDQIAEVFDRDKSVISRHIKNIFNEGELRRNSVVAFFATTASDGKTYQVEYFNLDVILSVGYRVNSKKATIFRQWATKILRQHITKGFTVNPKVIKQNYAQFQKAVDSVKHLLPAGMKTDTGSILELIKAFSATWFSLDAYDKEKFIKGKATGKKVAVAANDILDGIKELRIELARKKEAGDLFAVEKNSGAVEGIVGNVMQAFGGKELYESVEEKAAHLLYFMVKNHPFADGNKRSGAFAFVWFLRKNNALDMNRITPEALTALTLLIAESNPKDKDKMTGLVVMLLKG